MNAEHIPEPARNGFNALPTPEKEWFLIRVRKLTHRAAGNEQPAMNGRAAV
ncbi:hypothetical protein [Methanoregula sp. UBA64]|jgi:hypothetical protein|uniref:hypothetical protein n=1 Tax=Methanoregula sp. UBA64 TaxID=1915554 RepID=UPI0025CE9429|nr:hypothetical protein [Methanoregula sp. UBA64]